MIRALAIILTALALCASTARAQPIHAPGGVEIRAQNGRVTHLRAFGYADLEQDVPMRADAMLRIASLTKQFTAIAVLRLSQDGRLRLDDTLAEHLPDCPLAWRAITVRQLLSHTSGLSGDLAPLLQFASTDLTPRQLVDVFSGLAPAAAPGTRWEYANLNYWILGLVVESASGRAYAAYVDAQVLAPARLTSTRMGAWSPVIERRAHGYGPDGDGAAINARHFSQTLGYSAGGYLSTTRDLARWYNALGAGRIISLDLLREALTPVHLSNGEPTGYGLGWYLSQLDGHLVAHHGGSTFGFRAYLYWQPDSGAFAAVLMNSEGEEPNERARALLPQD